MIRHLRALCLALLLCGSAHAQVDSTPSVRMFYIAYNNDGNLDSIDGLLFGARAEFIVMDEMTLPYITPAVKGIKAYNRGTKLLRYNSFQDNFHGDSAAPNVAEDWYQHAHLKYFLGADSNKAYFYYDSATALDRGFYSGSPTTLPGAAFNSDTSLSRMPPAGFSNNNRRRLASYATDIVQKAYLNFYLSNLNRVWVTLYNGAAVYYDGIWHDNVGPGNQIAARSDSNLTGGRCSQLNQYRLGGAIYDPGWTPYWINNHRPFLTRMLDSLPLFPFTVPGKRYVVNNYAEVHADRSSTTHPFKYSTTYNDSDVCDFAFWELDFKLTKTAAPNLLSAGLADAGTSWATTLAAGYSPILYWERDSIGMLQGCGSWWYPRQTDPRPYGYVNWHYSNLAVYYMIRSPIDYITCNYGNSVKASAWGAGVGDTFNWIPAYGYNFGNDSQFSIAATTRRPVKFAASVTCSDCENGTPVGKDQIGRNWMAFGKHFTNGNLTLVRPAHEGEVDWSVVADAGNTSVTFKTNMPATTDGYYNGKLLRFTSGNLSGQQRQVTNFVAATKFITVSSAFSAAPAGATNNIHIWGAFSPPIPLGGSFKKLNPDGTLGQVITQDSLRSGEGGIYITTAPVDNPPVLNSIGGKSVSEAQLLTFSISATDDLSVPTLGATGLPSGAQFVDHGGGSGTFTWTPNSSQAGVYNVTFTSTDNIAQTDQEVVNITVTDYNPPTGGEKVRVRIGALDESLMREFGFRWNGYVWVDTIRAIDAFDIEGGALVIEAHEWTGRFDVDASGDVNIGDLTLFVDQLFHVTPADINQFQIVELNEQNEGALGLESSIDY